jgi:MFS family permease
VWVRGTVCVCMLRSYWFEDVIAESPLGFSLMGHHITNSSQSALAITQGVGTVGGFVFALPGGWLGDRFGRHVMLISTGFVTATFPLMNAFVPRFSWVLVCSALGGAMNGLAAGSTAALQADCLPVHPRTGQPMAAARDMLMIGVVRTACHTLPSFTLCERSRLLRSF